MLSTYARKEGELVEDNYSNALHSDNDARHVELINTQFEMSLYEGLALVYVLQRRIL
jgi:hypothetical protein